MLIATRRVLLSGSQSVAVSADIEILARAGVDTTILTRDGSTIIART